MTQEDHSLRKGAAGLLFYSSFTFLTIGLGLVTFSVSTPRQVVAQPTASGLHQLEVASSDDDDDGCGSASTASNYQTSKLTDHFYIVAASSSSECNDRCPHAKWVYSKHDDTLTQYELKYKDHKWTGMNRTYSQTGRDGKFSTDSGYCYIFHMQVHDGSELILTYTCGDYFDGVTVWYAGSQTISETFLDHVNDIIEDAGLSNYTVSKVKTSGCSGLDYPWW